MVPELNRIYCGDALDIMRGWPDKFVHTCITSPPYWGLRDYEVKGQLGLEKTPQEYVEKMVAVFREVRRVLRDDGTLWLNLGDSYAANRGYQVAQDKRGSKEAAEADAVGGRASDASAIGLKPKDLVGIPWRVAFALQADGWYLRQDIIWYKPNPMPESVTDRCTKAHEYLFLLAKSERYFYDAEAIKEPIAVCTMNDRVDTGRFRPERCYTGLPSAGNGRLGDPDRRNKRSVWNVSNQPFGGAHFATFPPNLIKPCVMAGASEHGVCADCGAPWERLTERSDQEDTSANGSRFDLGKTGTNAGGRCQHGTRMLKRQIGWQPSCTCHGRIVTEEYEVLEPEYDDEGGPTGNTERATRTRQVYIPGIPLANHPIARPIVLDPFGGSGTTGLVAAELSRDWLLIELNAGYAVMAERRIAPEHGQGKLF